MREANMERSTSSVTGRTGNGALIFGVTLIALGTAFTLDKLGVLEVGSYWRYWPVPVIGYGISRLLEPGERRFGLWILVFGVWRLVLSLELMSLWQSLAPLLITAGLILIGEALANGANGPAIAEDNHGR